MFQPNGECGRDRNQRGKEQRGGEHPAVFAAVYVASSYLVLPASPCIFAPAAAWAAARRAVKTRNGEQET